MVEFEWDSSKEESNIRKHGVSFWDAAESFLDPEGIQVDDQKHSDQEARFYWVGKTTDGRVLTSWFTWRGSKIRIIGCAEWRKFRRFYDKTTKAKRPKNKPSRD